jgi:hypothetical protein
MFERSCRPRVACAGPAAQLACNHSKHQYEEEEDEDPKRHQHAPALRVAPF